MHAPLRRNCSVCPVQDREIRCYKHAKVRIRQFQGESHSRDLRMVVLRVLFDQFLGFGSGRLEVFGVQRGFHSL